MIKWDAKSQEKRRWMVMLFIGTSALYASRTSVPLLIPAITKELNWSKKDSGTILSSFFWGYTLTQVMGGYVSDRVGGLRVIQAAAVGWSLFTFWMPHIITLFSDKGQAVNFIVLTRILHGALQGVHFPSVSSLTSRHLGELERASFFSVATSGSAVGTLLTGTVGSCVLDYFGWHAVFYAIGLFGIGWTLVLRHYALAATRRKATIISLPLKLQPSYGRDNVPVPWIRLFRKASFWSCVFGHACQNNCFFLLLSWLPSYFHDTFPTAKGWLVNMVPWLFSIPCTFLGKWLSERLIVRGCSVTTTRKVVETVGLGTQAAALLLIGHARSYQWALACMTLAVSASGFHNNAILVNPQDLAPAHAGSVFGLMNTVGAVPGFLGVYLAGFILDLTKSWSAVFRTTAAINALGCAVFLAFGSAEAIA
ncbi:voltage-gated purine nucleotide uniporter SLC17A9 isoform X2 [Bacillus rossius redtenbacheri]|uniref:voltage-gated purine nucleotide uniporter SLC17A9 isoform X2 n=1 Tax=Bacillus rossius redtenbacheri TaxID=93214 RepID=UPI002FDEA311